MPGDRDGGFTGPANDADAQRTAQISARRETEAASLGATDAAD